MIRLLRGLRSTNDRAEVYDDGVSVGESRPTGPPRGRGWAGLLDRDGLDLTEVGEPAEGVPDIHYTPGTPRSVLGGLAIRF